MPKDTEQNTAIAVIEQIEGRIYIFRGQRVMLDSDLAEVYQVATKMLNRAVKRNLARFPSDFVFQLTDEELNDLRRQIGTSKGASWWTALFALCFYGTRSGNACQRAE